MGICFVVTAAVIILIILGIFFLRPKNDVNANLQTARVERGDLIAIVGATGVVEPNQSVEFELETTGRVESVYVDVNDAG